METPDTPLALHKLGTRHDLRLIPSVRHRVDEYENMSEYCSTVTDATRFDDIMGGV
jgi:hypothetical protein